MRQQFYFFFRVSPFTFACMYSIQEGILWLGVKAQARPVIFHGVLIFHFNLARRRAERLLCCDFSEVAHAHSVLLKPIEHFELSPLSLWKQPFSKKKKQPREWVISPSLPFDLHSLHGGAGSRCKKKKMCPCWSRTFLPLPSLLGIRCVLILGFIQIQNRLFCAAGWVGKTDPPLPLLPTYCNIWLLLLSSCDPFWRILTCSVLSVNNENHSTVPLGEV